MSAPTTSKPLGTLSPSRLERLLGCPLRIAFEQSQAGAHQQVEPAAAVGLVVHRCIELLVSRQESQLDDAWHRACDDLVEQGADARAAPGIRRARLRLERRLPELLEYIESKRALDLRVECDLASSDGLVAGRLDLLIIADPSVVVDYKSGLVADDNELRPTYRRQLAIYAWLVADVLSIARVESALFSLRQGIYAVDVSADVQERVIAEARRARDAYNERTPNQQPATPAEASCGWCSFRTRCDEAWRALDDGRLERLGWGHAVRGTLLGSPTISQNGRAALILDAEQGTVSGRASLTDIPAQFVHGVTTGSLVSAVGLAIRSDDPLNLAWVDGTSSMSKDAR